MILPEALRLVDSGANVVVNVPPKPSSNVNGVEPDALRLTAVELIPEPLAPIKAISTPFVSTYFAVKI